MAQAAFDAAFAALRGGVTFDRRQNARSMTLFKANTNSGGPAAAAKAKGARVDTDFFGTNAKGGEHAKVAPKKAAKADSDESADEDSEDEEEEEEEEQEQQQPDLSTLQGRLDAHTRQARAAEEMHVMRKRHGIKVAGGELPAPLSDFADMCARFQCPDWLLARLAAAGWAQPTPIQRQAVPALLTGNELLAIAPTGSGKTLAFLLPIVVTLQAHERGGPRALLLCPTRELAMQTTRVLRQLLEGRTKLLRTSMVSKDNLGSVDYDGVDILLGNPLRVKKLIEAGKVKLDRVRFLVMDEADKLFEMGFVEQIDAAVGACTHPNVQRCLFSATLPETVEELARSVMAAPVRITVGERNTASASISQRLMFVGQEEGKLLAVRQLIRSGELRPPAIIFVQSKDRVKALYEELRYDGMHVGAIHADMSATKRSLAVDEFRAGEMWFLIATDLMARGVDFVGVNSVLNFDFPEAAITYIHRIGRTGRAGHDGHAVTLFTEEDAPHLRAVVNVMRASGCEVPEWMMMLKKAHKHRKRKVEVETLDSDAEDSDAETRQAPAAAKGAKGSAKEQGKQKAGFAKGAGKSSKKGAAAQTGGEKATGAAKRQRAGGVAGDRGRGGDDKQSRGDNAGKGKKAGGGGGGGGGSKKNAGFSTVPKFDVKQREKKRAMIEASKRRHAAT